MPKAVRDQVHAEVSEEIVTAFVPWSYTVWRVPGYVVLANGCHVWIGTTRNGYGLARDPRDGRFRAAHIIRYAMEVGPVPNGLVLDHFACDNTFCCNPLHVRPVTHRENTLRGDSVAALAASKTHCPNGHPYSGDNLVPGMLAKGGRACRICKRGWDHAQRIRKAARMGREALIAPANREYCPRGHFLGGTNLSQAHLRRGSRACRICINEEKARKYRDKKIWLGLPVFIQGGQMCRAGIHPLSGENLLAHYLKKGRRVCRACHLQWKRKRGQAVA